MNFDYSGPAAAFLNQRALRLWGRCVLSLCFSNPASHIGPRSLLTQPVTVVSEMPGRIKLAPACIIRCVVNICYGDSGQEVGLSVMCAAADSRVRSLRLSCWTFPLTRSGSRPASVFTAVAKQQKIQNSADVRVISQTCYFCAFTPK